MAIGLIGGIIPNPKRQLTVNFSIERVKEALKLSHHYLLDIKEDRSKYDDVLNIYYLHFSESLSLGAMIVILMKPISGEETVLDFEVQREFGSYDSDVEVTYANQQLNNLCETLSKILSMDETDLEKLRTGQMTILDSEKKSAKGNVGCGLIIVVVLVLFFYWLSS